MASTSTMQANVLKELGQNSSDSTLQARALRWLNKAFDMLQGMMPEAEYLQKSESYLTTVADQATYQLPASFFQIITLRDDDSATDIDIILREEFDRRHPDPSSESTGKVYEATLEYDPACGRHVIRCAPIPDDAYTLYATMRCWHPELSASQNPQYYKLETAIEQGAIYFGSLVFMPDQEWRDYRSELKALWVESMQSLSQVFGIQKAKPGQIPLVLRP